MALFPYNQAIRSTLYNFKGCFDYELKDVFFAYQLPYLKLLYRGYYVVCAPSSEAHNAERGFNHVQEMAATLALPQLDLLAKKTDVKQTTLSYEGRQKVGDNIIWKGDKNILRGKKILFVDDVYTTGATARACLAMLKEGHPLKLKALFMAKTKDLNDREEG